MRANKTKRQLGVKNRDVFMNAQSHLKWSSTNKYAVLARVRHCLHLLVRVDWCASRLVRFICCQIILTRESFDLPFTCHLSPSLTTFAFRSSEVRRLLLDFDP